MVDFAPPNYLAKLLVGFKQLTCGGTLLVSEISRCGKKMVNLFEILLEAMHFSVSLLLCEVRDDRNI
jgi:hypothetical protein